jgi:hypothetical protein
MFKDIIVNFGVSEGGEMIGDFAISVDSSVSMRRNSNADCRIIVRLL